MWLPGLDVIRPEQFFFRALAMRSIRRSAVVLAAMMFFVGGDVAFAQQGYSVGFGWLGGDSRAMFRLFGSQGSTRGIGSVSSTVTTLDGQGGYFAAGTLQPFVTDVIPVVGGQPRLTYSGTMGPLPAGGASYGPSALAERVARLESQGEVLGQRRAPVARGALPPDDESAPSAADTLAGDRSTAAEAVDSVASIRRQRAAAQAEAFRVAAGHFRDAAQAEAAGQTALAIYHYKIAAKDGDEAMRQQAAARLQGLQGAERE